MGDLYSRQADVRAEGVGMVSREGKRKRRPGVFEGIAGGIDVGRSSAVQAISKKPMRRSESRRLERPMTPSAGAAHDARCKRSGRKSERLAIRRTRPRTEENHIGRPFRIGRYSFTTTVETSWQKP
jgi:hypothetical protein